MTGRAVKAPGKAMLFGEYAVLDGGWGMVAAVDRVAIACLHDGAPASEFVTRAAAAARLFLAVRGRESPSSDHWPIVDSTRLYSSSGERKLGLGSSAAVTVAAFGAVLRAVDFPVDEASDRQDIFTACDGAHGTGQGARGSGLDIAAAVWGGITRARRGHALAQVEPSRWPGDVTLLLVDTGVPAETAERVRRYRALDRADRATSTLLTSLRTLADRATPTRVADPASGLCHEWNARLVELEKMIGLEIVTPAHRRIDELARAHGGSAKPSGAGGGDLAVCFVPSSAAPALAAALHAENLPPLDLTLGGPGLSPVTLATELPS